MAQYENSLAVGKRMEEICNLNTLIEELANKHGKLGYQSFNYKTRLKVLLNLCASLKKYKIRKENF